MKGAKVDEPRTEAGRRLLEASCDEYEWAAFEPDQVQPTIAAIEVEARSAALAEVEEAVKRLAVHLPPKPEDETDWYLVGPSVLAAIARLQEKSV